MDLKGMIAQPDGQLPHNRESLMQLVESHDPEAARAIGLADAGSGGMEGWGKTEIELFRLGLETLGRSFRHIAMVLQVSSECKQHGPDQTVALGKALFRWVKLASLPGGRLQAWGS